MTTLAERVANDEIGIEILSANTARDDEGWDHYAYEVRLSGQRFATLRTPFRMGLGIQGDPTAEMVLESLLSDASTYENTDSFEAWADEYGYDTDSRKAERTYNEVKAQTEGLRRFLGADYKAYLWETDRD